MPQEPLPKLNKKQNALWNRILAIMSELKEQQEDQKPTEKGQFVCINFAAFNDLRIRLSEERPIVRDLLKELWEKTLVAYEDPKLCKFATIPRLIKQREIFKSILGQ